MLYSKHKIRFTEYTELNSVYIQKSTVPRKHKTAVCGIHQKYRLPLHLPIYLIHGAESFLRTYQILS